MAPAGQLSWLSIDGSDSSRRLCFGPWSGIYHNKNIANCKIDLANSSEYYVSHRILHKRVKIRLPSASSHWSEWIFISKNVQSTVDSRWRSRWLTADRTADDAKWWASISWFPFLSPWHYAKENHYSQTAGRMIITITGEPLLFLAVKNSTVMFMNNRLKCIM